MPGRESLAVGVLVNTRGLVELVVLNAGVDLHVLSPTLFSMMVIMALATTMMTAPLIDRVLPRAV
jgi:Kef-type K+ transport system membrane component KefB